ncbi:DNA polymerase III, epsilon subunit [Denitrovibrio acetiphilus DSM 12809]|uniref:DNA polymerase III, epsilon subunit n=1 Tax=Denitrovibrio acetiphilus (strain DSM 12809 / NBRC 114555 / N2460) TaxID=522772 RepID=D4H0V9_DENA2|nr:3'-5' exonuclease [Denitrovibrio acetiphilus]ADD68622.1 DNA polymerase III, epsilon subunit [Denitrovibrio acetiphilus DSM 12809]
MFDIPFDQLTFTVFDTETTGMSPDKGARLLEIGAVKVKPGLVLDLQDSFCTLINPKAPIPYNAYSVHGISTAMVADKPEIKDVLPGFFSFTENTIIAAHNARFDCSFVSHHSAECCIVNPMTKIVDTVKLAKSAHSGLKSYSLGNLIHYFSMDIPLPDTYRHRALYDAAHTALLLTICLKKLAAQDICTMRHISKLPKSPIYLWQ